MFVGLPDRPEVIALVDAPLLLPGPRSDPREQWPGVGEEVAAVVSGHAEHDRQTKLRVD
ncbi:hypothetical protein [Streptacidiphilus neutrinimicus]|uniref:hypothetical protein n=1 Tax=Streptacidiphilus neutrinimicus TaxID=105420 RepID=UPI000A831456|nr:hypothetical protein [Streptacidiphilus neutrinimicus]